jgi:hypothetical protein
MNNSERRRTYNEIDKILQGTLHPSHARLINHLIFFQTGSDIEVEAMIQFLDASDKFMEGLDNMDFDVSSQIV